MLRQAFPQLTEATCVAPQEYLTESTLEELCKCMSFACERYDLSVSDGQELLSRLPSWCPPDTSEHEFATVLRHGDDTEHALLNESSESLASISEPDKPFMSMKLLAEAAIKDQRSAEGGGSLIRLLGLPPLSENCNLKQGKRIKERRRMKIRVQAERVLRGYLKTGNVSMALAQSLAARLSLFAIGDRNGFQ